MLVELQDNGIGLESVARERIFDLFAQGASESARAEGGLGIELAVAKRMVELHGGEISLYSNGPGCGTTVRLRLPILRSIADTHITHQAKASFKTKRARLLVVDDNRDALEALGVLLEVEGYEVATSDNGADAIRLMSEHHLTVALIDVGMPVMDGFEVARRPAGPWLQRRHAGGADRLRSRIGQVPGPCCRFRLPPVEATFSGQTRAHTVRQVRWRTGRYRAALHGRVAPPSAAVIAGIPNGKAKRSLTRVLGIPVRGLAIGQPAR